MWLELDHALGEGNLSVRQYNLMIGLTLFWGLGINALICVFCTDFFLSINPVALIVGYFISAIIGIVMAKGSGSAIVSFIGYNLVVLPVGAVLSVALAEYAPGMVQNAIVSTAIVCLMMIIVATIKPSLFEGLGSTLFIALSLSIVVEFFMMLFGVHLAIMDWVVLIIFCGYIGFDWNRANSYAPTADNAIDSALELYLDIINIFLRILSIMARSNSRRGRN